VDRRLGAGTVDLRSSARKRRNFQIRLVHPGLEVVRDQFGRYQPKNANASRRHADPGFLVHPKHQVHEQMPGIMDHRDPDLPGRDPQSQVQGRPVQRPSTRSLRRGQSHDERSLAGRASGNSVHDRQAHRRYKGASCSQRGLDPTFGG